MATDMLPGSFPDSVPATPDETPQPPTPAKHRQHDNLHDNLRKPGDPRDPRTHNYTDSGIELTESEPIQSAKPAEYKLGGTEEAVRGGIFARDRTETGTPSTASPAQHDHDDSNLGTDKINQLAPDLAEGMPDPARPTNAKAVDHGKQSSRESAPYWGDLPAQAGKGVYNSVAGVYNSVTGQGNASTEETEQTHSQSKPASGPSNISGIAGQVGDTLRSGAATVYNSMPGLGNASSDRTEKGHPEPTAETSSKPGVVGNVGNNIKSGAATVYESLPSLGIASTGEAEQRRSHPTTESSNSPGVVGQVGNTLRSGAATVFNSVPGLGNDSSGRTEQSHPQPTTESSDRTGIVGNVGSNLRAGAATTYESLPSMGTANASQAERTQEKRSLPTTESDSPGVVGQVGNTLSSGAATAYNTAAGGASTVYDAVTGHRTATDDQAEQHQRPGSKSSDKTIVPGQDGGSELPQESKYSHKMAHAGRGEGRQSAHSQRDVLKEPARGVYNSVAGHGSAVDDHDQHHHLRPKSKSPERAVIVGHVGDYPRGGGVYNTVVGHGSRDKEAKRHTHSPPRSTDKAANMPVHAGQPHDMFGGPWPDVPAGGQRNSGNTTTSPHNAHGVAPGFLPELAVRDDVHFLAEAKARDAERARSQPKYDTSPHRAFPLAPKGAQHHGEGTGAAGVSTGITAGQYLRDRREDSTRLSQRAQGDKESGPVTGRERRRSLGGHTAESRRRSRQRSPVENTGSHQDDSPSKHKLFGIFHRHKDRDKEEPGAHRRKSTGDHGDAAREGRAAAHSPNRLQKQIRGGSTGERKRSLSRSKVDGDKRTSIGKDNVAVGAGAFGVLHHKQNSVNERSRDTQAPNWPLTADAGGVGSAGETSRQIEQVSTPFEHPREAPLPPWSGSEQLADAAGEYHHSSTLPGGTQSSVHHAKAAPSANREIVINEPGHYKTLPSGTPSGVTVASAAKPERQDVVSHERGDYNVLASSGSPKIGTTRKDVKPREAGDYHVQNSSGSPATARQDDAEDAAEYNVLPSGTPSGVKVKPRSPHHSHDQISRGQHNPRLPEEPPSLPPVDVASHAQTLRDLPAPATASKPSAAEGLTQSANPTYPHAEMVQHMSPEVMPDSYRASAPGHSDHHAAHASQAPASQSRMVAAQNMSPEVVPDAYTAFAPGHSQHAAHAQQTHQPQLRGGDADEHNNNNGKSFSDRLQDVTRTRNGNGNADIGRNAALAAATSSWAAGSTMGSGVGGVQGGNTDKVVHLCEHCGRENDITRYFNGQGNSAGGLERSGSGLWQGRRG